MRAPFDAGDGHALATALDDIVDYAEQVADTLGIYAVEASMEAAVDLADVLVGAAEQVSRALRCLRTGTESAPHLVEIHRLENEGDRIRRDAVASLFVSGTDPRQLAGDGCAHDSWICHEGRFARKSWSSVTRR